MATQITAPTTRTRPAPRLGVLGIAILAVIAVAVIGVGVLGARMPPVARRRAAFRPRIA